MFVLHSRFSDKFKGSGWGLRLQEPQQLVPQIQDNFLDVVVVVNDVDDNNALVVVKDCFEHRQREPQ